MHPSIEATNPEDVERESHSAREQKVAIGEAVPVGGMHDRVGRQAVYAKEDHAGAVPLQVDWIETMT